MPPREQSCGLGGSVLGDRDAPCPFPPCLPVRPDRTALPGQRRQPLGQILGDRRHARPSAPRLAVHGAGAAVDLHRGVADADRFHPASEASHAVTCTQSAAHHQTTWSISPEVLNGVGWLGLSRTYNPQSLATVAKTPEDPMFRRVRRVLTVLRLWCRRTALRDAKCRQL